MVKKKELEEKQENVTSLKIGDVEILTTKGSLSKCIKSAEMLLQNTTISKYLNSEYPKKKFIGID